MSAITLLPPALDLVDSLLLIGLSFFTSGLTAAMGIGGGSLLIAVMAQLVPASAIVPVHALVQLGSNSGRTWLFREYVNWSMLGWFALGCIGGSLLGGQLALSLPAYWIQLLLAIFILLSAWLPLKLPALSPKLVGLLGLATAFLTMLVGATGPVLMSGLKHLLHERMRLVANMAAMLSTQHVIKALVFGLLGFAYQQWLGLIVLMVASGFCGTVCGRQLLRRSNDQRFHFWLKWLLTLLALKLGWDGLFGR
ncbi:sulfite exporter TauE/SafE family protein [Aliagarivorans marinus]|uniref:sulfite exporter TauE/SafE family protein n=1 Tax=Aliagarivorans marinus TaxID=561965 RepID=UPI0004190976|nr:sulfite exporter TauE/SafE family protein [Aliagarivorans marinus]